MRHINSINGINQQADLSKPGSNVQDASSQKAANSKLFATLQSQSQAMRGAAQENSQLGSSKIKERTEYAKDFTNYTKDSQDASDRSVGKTQESNDLMSSSYFKKTESRLLKDQAKTESGEVAAELRRQAKEKLRESVTEEKDSRKAYNKSQEEDMVAFQASMDASSSQDLSSNAGSQGTQAQIKAVTLNNEATQTAADAAAIQTQTNQIPANEKNVNSTAQNNNKNTFSANSAQDVSGGSAYSGGFDQMLGTPNNANGYKGFDQSYANDWKNGTGIYTNNNVGNNNSGDASGGAGSNQFGADGLSASGNAYLEAARMMLRTVMQVTISSRSSNPIVQISKNLTNKTLSDQAVAYLEAAQVDTALNGTAVNQQIILTKAQASTIGGEAQTGINYWKQVLEDNKQLEKQTHDMAKAVS